MHEEANEKYSRMSKLLSLLDQDYSYDSIERGGENVLK